MYKPYSQINLPAVRFQEEKDPTVKYFAQEIVPQDSDNTVSNRL